MICNIHCTAKAYDFPKLQGYLEKKDKTMTFHDVIYVKKHSGHIFYFRYGVVILWNIPFDDEKRILDEVEAFEEEPLDTIMTDKMPYLFKKDKKTTTIKDNHIYLHSNDSLLKLSISYALAQSIKLSVFEERVHKTIDNVSHIPQKLANSGNIELSPAKISKLRGELFLARSYINLQFDLLDTPRFFWEYTELEQWYTITSQYMEIKMRIDILNKKLDLIHDLFEMIADEQKHKHSSFLEWIIIFLILFEVVFSLYVTFWR